MDFACVSQNGILVVAHDPGRAAGPEATHLAVVCDAGEQCRRYGCEMNKWLVLVLILLGFWLALAESAVRPGGTIVYETPH